MRKKSVDKQPRYVIVARKDLYTFFRNTSFGILRDFGTDKERNIELQKLYGIFKLLPEEFKDPSIKSGLEFVVGKPLEEPNGLELIAGGPQERKKRYYISKKELCSYKGAGEYLRLHPRTIGRLVLGRKLITKNGKQIVKRSLVKFAKEMKDYYFLSKRLDHLQKGANLKSQYYINNKIRDHLINFGGKKTQTVLVYRKEDEEEILNILRKRGHRKRKIKNSPLMSVTEIESKYNISWQEVQNELGPPQKIDELHTGWPEDKVKELAGAKKKNI